jgi:hypothetical protein
MFLIDDILLSPITGLLLVFRELRQAVQKDATNEAEAIRAELTELYLLLETAQITEAEADAREKELLDCLEEIETRGRNSEADEEDGEEPTDERQASAPEEYLEPSPVDGS